MHRKTLPAKHFFIPIFLLIVALIWGAADIGKGGAIAPFSWGNLFSFKGWLEPIKLTGSDVQSLSQLAGIQNFSSISCFQDSEECWVTEHGGSMIHTQNDGKSWRLQRSKQQATQKIYFASKHEAWKVGSKGTILYTSDAGNKWTQQLSNNDAWLNDVFFISPSQGWVVGVNGTILYTNNGGRTWGSQISNTTKSLSAIYFIDRMTGWAIGGEGIILHTDNGGEIWKPQNSPINKHLNAIYFISPTQGWIGGSQGVILSTHDGGKTWKSQQNIHGGSFLAIYFASASHGWAVGDQNAIFHTTDGGVNWIKNEYRCECVLTDISFTTDKVGWLVGTEGAILQTKDGGITWQRKVRTNRAWFRDVYFVSSSHGWIVGDRGTILHTDNSGKSWAPQTTNTETPLESVFFTSEFNGWAVGDKGEILRTNNGGQTWTQQITNTRSSLTSVHFSTSQRGWVVGSGGTILFTSNGGLTWNAQKSGTSKLLSKVIFTSEGEGWVFGLNGTILHTKDGGTTWQQQASNTQGWLTSAYFLNENQGWAAGWDAPLLETSNGGVTWNSVEIDSNFIPNDIVFTSPLQGWIADAGGAILSTVDGGRSWQQHFTGSAMNGVHFPSSRSGIAVGNNGTVFYSSNRGKSWERVFSPNQNFYEQLRDTRFGNYYHWPSPLALLLLLISLLWLFITLRTASKNPSDYLSDERGGIADAPVQFLDEDKLGYAPLARGIYKLIRNVDSKPPLAIAVSAPWGQGKSSVMNMLHSLLKNDNAVVQFNAWHYRDDNHILAALIEHIRAQAVPNGISLANLGFRWNLLWRRLLAPYWRWWAVVLPVGWCTAWQMGREFDLEWDAIYAHIDQQANELIKPLSALIGEKFASASPAIGVLLLLLASPLIVKKILAPLKSFTPSGEASLYSAAWNSFKTALQTTGRDWEEDAGIRFQFQQDFSDICHALGSRKLVLLIDDLDRCDPKQIEQIINTLNFLFSNNMPCYVVMALDWDYVRTALGVAYKDMANALHHKIKVPKGESRAEIFAENYLRKIIQLKVELPEVDVVAAFAEQARLAKGETNAIPIGKLIKKMASDTLKIFTSIKQVLSANPVHGIDNAVDKLRPPIKINLWDWTKSAGKFFCFLVKALVIEPIGGRLKRHGENDAYRLGNLIVTVFFACLFSALIVAALIAITGNAKSNPVSSTERVEASTVATADAQPAPPANPQKRFAKDTTNNPPMLVLDPQKNSAGPVFHLFMIGLGFVGIFWMFWFMRQERDSAEFKQALAAWKLQLSHKVQTPREWRRLENNLRFFIMLARGYDYLPVHKQWQRFMDKIKMRLIAYVESTSYQPPEPFVFDEGIATRLIMADIYLDGDVYRLLEEALNSDNFRKILGMWQLYSRYKIDPEVTKFFNRCRDLADDEAGQQLERWLNLYSFKLQLPYKTKQ